MNKIKSAKIKSKFRWILLPITVVSFLGILYVLFQNSAKEYIIQDVERHAESIKEGDLTWTAYSDVEIAGEFYASLGKRNPNVAADVSLVASNNATYDIGTVFPWGCKVKWEVQGFSAASFFEYCSREGIMDSAGAYAAFKDYSLTNYPDFSGSVTVTYRRTLHGWTADYYSFDFINVMTCGLLSEYASAYSEIGVEIDSLLEEIEND